MANYSIQFQTLHAESTSFDVLLHGLSDSIKLVPCKLPSDLDAVISLAVRIYTQREEEREGDVIPPHPPSEHQPGFQH